MDEILLEINTAGEELTTALNKFEQDEMSLSDLDELHHKLGGIFDTIKLHGVNRSDIQVLNKLGLIEVEEKYYSDIRSAIGMDVALEAEGSTNWLSLVIGAVMAAMVAVLAFFAGKLLGWLLDSTDSLSGSSSKSQSKTKVKITKGAKRLKLDLSKVAKNKGTNSGHLDVVALANLGDDYLKGDKLKELFDSSTDAVKEVNSVIDSYTNGGLQSELDSLVNGRDLTNRANRETVLGELKPSNVTIDLVKATYPILFEVMGDVIDKEPALDRDGNDLPSGSIMAKSQRVCNFKGTDIFSSKLVTKTEIDLIMNPEELDSKLDEGDVKSLTKLVETLEAKYGSSVSGKGRVSGELNKRGFSDVSIGNKSTDIIVRNYINYQVTYPIKYVNTVVSKVLAGLLKAHVRYRAIQAKFQSQYGKIFFDEQLLKIINIIEGTNLEDSAKKKLINELGNVRGEEIDKASEIIAKVLNDLIKLGDDVKGKLESIEFYKRANGNLNKRGSELTEVLLD